MGKWTPPRCRSPPLLLISTDEMLGLIKASLSSSPLVEESLRSSSAKGTKPPLLVSTLSTGGEDGISSCFSGQHCERTPQQQHQQLFPDTPEQNSAPSQLHSTESRKPLMRADGPISSGEASRRGAGAPASK